MVDIATGWTECMPLVAREGSLVVEAMTQAQRLFPRLLRGADFDNDSAFMNCKRRRQNPSVWQPSRSVAPE